MYPFAVIYFFLFQQNETEKVPKVIVHNVQLTKQNKQNNKNRFIYTLYMYLCYKLSTARLHKVYICIFARQTQQLQFQNSLL